MCKHNNYEITNITLTTNWFTLDFVIILLLLKVNAHISIVMHHSILTFNIPLPDIPQASDHFLCAGIKGFDPKRVSTKIAVFSEVCIDWNKFWLNVNESVSKINSVYQKLKHLFLGKDIWSLEPLFCPVGQEFEQANFQKFKCLVVDGGGGGGGGGVFLI